VVISEAKITRDMAKVRYKIEEPLRPNIMEILGERFFFMPTDSRPIRNET
jgi:hypothetical protein